MDNYFVKENKNLSDIRKILVSLVGDLNKRLRFNNYVDGDLKQIEIPFYFSMGGEETFLQDNFIKDASQDINNQKIESHYEEIPRGYVDVGNINLDTDTLTNKWARLFLELEEEGQLKRIATYTRLIPISFSVDCRIIIDNILNSFLITESLLKEIYKRSATFYDFHGVPVAISYRFPFDTNKERSVEYSWNDKKNNEITFNLNVNSFLIDIVEDSKVFAGDRMQNLTVRLFDKIQENK